jgi:surface carbohydrate biosynthesis protein
MVGESMDSAIKGTLIIPVENQVRELDPKLLLAYIAAQRGFSSILGFRREIHFHISSFPPGIYLSKSMTAASDLMFNIMRKLGHEIVAWDEEALVHLPPDTYFSRRLSPAPMAFVSHMLAWGKDNAELWKQYPHFPDGAQIHIAGNPRNDLLRPEIRHFYEETVAKLRERHGDFILINTNFNHVNAFYPGLNLFVPNDKPGGEPRLGRAAKGMTREYAEGLKDHKQAIFEKFQQLIPAVENAFPEYTIVVRPHPTENQEIYRKIAAGCERVEVTNEGNVVPWLMAARVLIHNGCTTGVEAYVMGVPAISYRAAVNDFYDLGFYRLPNLLSYQCFDFEELRLTLEKILTGELGAAIGDERKTLVNQHLAALEGPLACERIVDVCENITYGQSEKLKPKIVDRFTGYCMAKMRTLKRQIKAHLPRAQNKPEFHRHRYPEVSLDEMRARLSRLQHVLGHNGELKVEQIRDKFFRVCSGSA